jgi:hypothetical protein
VIGFKDRSTDKKKIDETLKIRKKNISRNLIKKY